MSLKNKIKSFRKSLAKKVFDKKHKTQKEIEISNIKSILFLRDDDKIGDMVVSTLMFREIKNKYPDIKIFVLCGKNNSQIIKNNPYIDGIYKISGKFFKDYFLYKKIAGSKINIAVDFFPFRPRPLHMLKLRKIAVSFLIGFHKDDYNIYDRSINADFKTQHITNVYSQLLSYLNIKEISLSYDVFLNEKEDNYGKDIREKYKDKKLIFLNTYAAKKRKTLSKEKISDLISLILNKYPQVQIILNTENSLKSFFSKENRIFISEEKEILYTASLIKYSDIIITPDTSIVHIASAFNKKTIAIYLDDSCDDEKLNTVWAPNNPNAVQLIIDTKNGQLENDIKNMDNKFIIDNLESLG